MFLQKCCHELNVRRLHSFPCRFKVSTELFQFAYYKNLHALPTLTITLTKCLPSHQCERVLKSLFSINMWSTAVGNQRRWQKRRDQSVLSSSLWCIFPFREKYMDPDIALQIPFQVSIWPHCCLIAISQCMEHSRKRAADCASYSSLVQCQKFLMFLLLLSRIVIVEMYECATTDLYSWWK